MKPEFQYLIKATVDEYRMLKGRESRIFELAKMESRRNAEQKDKEHYDNINGLLKYNPSRGVVGIFLNKNGKEKLIIDLYEDEADDYERKFVLSADDQIRRELEKIKMPGEKWVESV